MKGTFAQLDGIANINGSDNLAFILTEDIATTDFDALELKTANTTIAFSESTYGFSDALSNLVQADASALVTGADNQTKVAAGTPIKFGTWEVGEAPGSTAKLSMVQTLTDNALGVVTGTFKRGGTDAGVPRSILSFDSIKNLQFGSVNGNAHR